MPSFLSFLAEKIAATKIPLENTTVVVPNKRAKRELLRELALRFTKPVFAPNIISVNEFIESLSTLKKIEKDELLIRLFEIYKKKESVETRDDTSFQAFLTWAPLFLQDISEIDMHLVDASAIFTNLSDIKTLETSFGKEILTEMQRKYIEFYTQLADLYSDFTQMLRDENLGYEGMIYRNAANCFNYKVHNEITKATILNDPCESLSVHRDKNSRFIFAGINAATPSELEILHFFYLHKNAEIYFDIDSFYDENYGGFIKEIQQKLRIPKISKSNFFKDIPKQISCLGAPKRTAQVYQTIDILNAIELKQGNLNNTVLVFADQSMLIPFVHAYNCENANITMGYPLTATTPVQKLFQYIDEEKLNNRLQKSLFDLKTQGFEFLQFLKEKFQLFEKENTALEADIFYSLIVNIIEDVSALLGKFFSGAAELDFVIVEYLLMEKLNSAAIPYSGNPHEGLQIMGLLETRMLDFKNVIVLNLNEGVLPKGKIDSSLLLFDIKRHFQLPLSQYNDAIMGYHFFRLLQCAENIYLIYDNDSTGNLAEKSRFVEQLAFEVKKQGLQQSIKIDYRQFSVPFSFSASDSKISITKNNAIIEKLSNYRYSPSSLITYIQCPLKFYLQHIEKIKTQETFDESKESAIIGTVIHCVLEEIFVKLQQNPSQFSTILAELAENIEEFVHFAFKKQPELANEDFEQGKLFLAGQIVKKTVLDYIEVVSAEWKKTLFQIICTEKWLNAEVEIEGYRLRFAGKTDRVEMRDNKVTVLDYKTGFIEPKNLKCKADNFENIFTDSKYSQLFQLLCYAYLYQNDKDNSLLKTAEIQCGIIAFQELYKQNEDYICYTEIEKEKIMTSEVLQLFEEHLKKVFSSILDVETAFTQTEEEDNCKYCDYKGICKK
ncbi:MAG: PD-(D/E)XK nuclease family protein [Bacteroidales bacterium]|jgi:hypothetical protein|nr:PD-(D/E)XK nuclease family protein [Bacteroidales bacterium]